MENLFCGIVCTAKDSDVIYRILEMLQNLDADFYIPEILIGGTKDNPLPFSQRNLHLTGDDFPQLLHKNIWEMSLHIYPRGEQPGKIISADDFLKSNIQVYLYYFDCRNLQICMKTEYPELLQLLEANSDWIEYETGKDNQCHWIFT